MGMRISLVKRVISAIGYAIAATSVCAFACAQSSEVSPTSEPESTQLPVRFVLTFDDGPDGHKENNSTASILNTLAENSTQNNLKAIFFVETRRKKGGGTKQGRALLDREHTLGHVLALHDGSSYGHPNHCDLS